MKLPFVSIIILNYNGKQLINDCLNSLKNINYPKNKYEIIVGDNASNDDSVQFIKKNFKNIKLLQFRENYGFCKGNNLCVKEAKGDYLLFLNNDTIVNKFWLINLVKPLLSKKEVISTGCKMIKPYNIDGKKVIDYAGGKFSYEIHYYIGINEFDKNEYDIEKYTAFGCGAGVIVNKDFFWKIGGFDEYYFGGGEEVELGMRIWQAGYKVLYVPSSILIHKRGVTFSKINYFAVSMWAKSILYFIFKNYELKNIIKYLTENLIFVQAPKIIYFLIKLNPKGAFAVIRGNYWFLKDVAGKGVIKKIIYERKRIKKIKKISDKELCNLGLCSTFVERFKYRLKNLRAIKFKYGEKIE